VSQQSEAVIRVALVKPSDLMAFVSPQPTSYKRPSEIIVLHSLPAISTEKILRHKLAESLQRA
jgi:acyl-CoA synthetase (AMP-forming)/AMP-acid ligase II